MKKQEEPVIWDKSHHSIFEDFALDLEHYADTEEYPAYADQDVKYGLELACHEPFTGTLIRSMKRISNLFFIRSLQMYGTGMPLRKNRMAVPTAVRSARLQICRTDVRSAERFLK